jgi:SRSO17 transposase
MIIQHENWNRQLPPLIDLQEKDLRNLSHEFERFHRLFDKAFYRVEQTILSRHYLHGLMSALERKSMEPIALSFMDTHRVSALQKFVSYGKWDTETLATLHKQEAAKTVADPQGVISVDGSDFHKKGKESVGVARQYCGHLGKVDNCQAGVFLAYSSPKGYLLLDRRLFLPEIWFSKEYEQRWQKCKIPENTPFKTKNQLALEMIQEIQRTCLFPAKWITCDESFGRDSKFLDSLPNESFYFAEVPNNTHVWIKHPRTAIPAYSGKGRKPKRRQCLTKSIPVSKLSKNSKLNWQRVSLAEGAKGPIMAEITRLRAVESRGGLPGKEIWLFFRRSIDQNEIKYFVSNADPHISMEEMCHVCTMRWPIEQCFREGKNELGMDHYEHRRWEAWHRHMTFVFLAQLFLLQMRLKLKKNSSADIITDNHIDEGHIADQTFQRILCDRNNQIL